MCADRNVDALVLFRHRRTAILIDSVAATCAPLTLSQIKLGAKRQQRRRIDIRIDLIVDREDARSRACGLRGCSELQAVAVEVATARPDCESDRTNRLRSSAQINLIVKLLANF